MAKQSTSGDGLDRKSGKISGVHNVVSAEDRHQRIAEAAYFIAEQRGFTMGYEVDDWLYAEAEVNDRLQRSDH